MPEFEPHFLTGAAGGRWTCPPRSPLTGFTADSRTLRPGQVFVAVRTERRDGHDFLAAAAAAGAPAALVSAPRAGAALPQLVVPDPLSALQAIARAHRRAFTGPVVGITGSAGKTSTKELLALLLGAADGASPSPVLATEGNLNNHLGVPLTLLRLDPAAHRFAVIEAGISAPGEMAPLADMIEPDLVLVTLVAAAHLAALGGLEGVAREKAVLAARVRPGGCALFPPQCASFAAFRALSGPTQTVAAEVRQLGETTEFTIPGDAAGPYALRRVSAGMAGNAALAVSAARRLGIPPDQIRSRLARWAPAPLRGQVRRDGGRLVYLDCYNANPASMADALAGFAGLAPAGPARLFVLGCMEELGAGSARYHRELGESLRLGPADLAILIGEQAGEIQAGARAGGARADQLVVAADAADVRGLVEGFAGPVFIKGSRRYRLEILAPGAAALQGAH
jgi:UDP-N-acetylmuramoyl-tripeptide--D-alanyl-D-alanine ligase